MKGIAKALTPLLNMIPQDSLHDVILQQIVNVAEKRSGGDYWETPNEFVNKLRKDKGFSEILDKAKITDDEIREQLEKL